MAKSSFIPNKPLIIPLHEELLVSYGDRLLWHQPGLQLTGHPEAMLTEEEYVAIVRGFYPDADEVNVWRYRGYFNGRQNTMGFRDSAIEMPIHVEFVE